MRNPRPAINTFPTPSQELTMFALLAPSILFLCIAIWHKEANYTEECVGSINLHDVTKCNKNEGISKKKNLNYYSERSVLSPVNGACLHLVFWKEILPQAVKKLQLSLAIYNFVTLHQGLGRVQVYKIQGDVRLMGHTCAHSRSWTGWESALSGLSHPPKNIHSVQ